MNWWCAAGKAGICGTVPLYCYGLTPGRKGTLTHGGTEGSDVRHPWGFLPYCWFQGSWLVDSTSTYHFLMQIFLLGGALPLSTVPLHAPVSGFAGSAGCYRGGGASGHRIGWLSSGSARVCWDLPRLHASIAVVSGFLLLSTACRISVVLQALSQWSYCLIVMFTSSWISHLCLNPIELVLVMVMPPVGWFISILPVWISYIHGLPYLHKQCPPCWHHLPGTAPCCWGCSSCERPSPLLCLADAVAWVCGACITGATMGLLS